jgi:hypothetical protein
MALSKLAQHLVKSDPLLFPVPSVVTAPSHGAVVTLSNVGGGDSSPATFLNGSITLENWGVNEFIDIADFDFILPSSPVSNKALRRSSSSTAQDANTLNLDERKMKESKLIKLRGQEGPVRQFKVLQQFEGKVTEVYEGDTFRADLIDLTDSTREQESAEFSLDDIHPADRNLVTPGSVFYWIMGFETTPSDYKRVSEIRLRRSPRWSEYDIDTFSREGQDRYNKFTSGQGNAPAKK